MSAAQSALVVGGGVAGMSAALMLARAGVKVRLIDSAREWSMAGAGLTITRSTLRALQKVGLLEAVMARGHTHDGIQVCDVGGKPLRFVESPPLPDAEVPGAGGILRATLHQIMSEQLRASAIPVTLGVTVAALQCTPEACKVSVSDGTQIDVDLVVGADGLFSAMRAEMFPEAPPPTFTGQACWRWVLPRLADITNRHFFLGGPVKVGLTPVSQSEMYLFLLEQVPDNPWRAPETWHETLGHLLRGYGGLLDTLRQTLNPRSQIVYRPLESHLLRHAWWKDRVILIGDAAHATTPQLASGAGMGLEDGIVLAEEIKRADTLPAAFDRFMERRFERCRLVVENSLEIGRLEMSGATPAAQTAVVDRSLAALAQPI